MKFTRTEDLLRTEWEIQLKTLELRGRHNPRSCPELNKEIFNSSRLINDRMPRCPNCDPGMVSFSELTQDQIELLAKTIKLRESVYKRNGLYLYIEKVELFKGMKDFEYKP